MGIRVSREARRYGGWVSFYDPIPYALILRWQDAFRASREMKTNHDRAEVLIPILLEAIEEWGIDGVPQKPTFETMPGSPIKDAQALIDWLWREFIHVFAGDLDPDPNA